MNRDALMLVLLLITITSRGIGQTPEPASKPDTKPPDISNPLDLLGAVASGGGWDSSRPTAYAGAKIGGGYVTVDLGYDRVQNRSGFSTELSGMVPVLRWPGPREDDSKNFLRVYAEPGIGHRWGSGGVGSYLSGKVMVALLSDRRLNFSKSSPYIEFQRRFPVNSLLRGDNRITVGIMIALCNHCGFD